MDKFLEKHGFITEKEKLFGALLLVIAGLFAFLFFAVLFNYFYLWSVLNG